MYSDIKLSRSFARSLAFCAALSLPLSTSPNLARADTPLAGVAVGFVVGVGSSLVASAIYDAVTTDTTTTKTTTTTDADGATTTETTTTTSQMQTPPADDSDLDIFGVNGDGSKMFPPFAQKFPPLGWPKMPKVPDGRTSMGIFVDSAVDDASIHATPAGTQKIEFKVERVFDMQFKRKDPGNLQDDMVLSLVLGQLFASTRDIPGTRGAASVSLELVANGEIIYKASTQVRQAKEGSFETSGEKKNILVNKPDMISMGGLVEQFQFSMKEKRDVDSFQLRVTTQGVGEKV